MKKLSYVLAIGLLLCASCSGCGSKEKEAERLAREAAELQAQRDSIAAAEEAARIAAEKAAAEEAARIAQEEAAKKEAARRAAARRAAKLAAEKAAAEKAAAEEAERLAAEEAAARAEAERIAAEKAAAEAAARAEAERIAAEKAAAEAAARAAAEKEAARIAAEKAAIAQAAAIKAAATKPLYVQATVSASAPASEGTLWFRSDNGIGHTLGFVTPDVAITIGKEFTPVWGWRASLQLNTTAAHKTDGKYYQQAAEVFGDVTFDLLDAFDYGKIHKWDVSLFAGAGLSWVGNQQIDSFPKAWVGTNPYAAEYSHPLCVAGRAGLSVNRKITDNLAIGAEGALYVLPDKFNAQVGGAPIDMRATLGLNLRYYFGQKCCK